jgi:Fe-S oxidoreductase
LARASFGLANRLNRVKPVRGLIEAVGGIHRDKLLPEFAASTFEQRVRRRGRLRSAPPAEAVLFQTCYVQNNEPEIGLDALWVLEHNGVDVGCVSDLACCGMPAWEHGDLATLRRNARRNLDRLMPFVDSGSKVLAVNPTCSMMLRREYPELLEGEDRQRARALAAAVRDPCEYLWSIRKEPRFRTEFASSPGKIAYHAPCHLRAQGVGFKGRDLLRLIPGASVSTVMECSAHDGTYAMKAECYESSCRIGKRAFDGMRSAEAGVWSTECPLAAIQLQQHAGRKPLHPLSVLARAYRGDPFEATVARLNEEKDDESS